MCSSDLEWLHQVQYQMLCCAETGNVPRISRNFRFYQYDMHRFSIPLYVILREIGKRRSELKIGNECAAPPIEAALPSSLFQK